MNARTAKQVREDVQRDSRIYLQDTDPEIITPQGRGAITGAINRSLALPKSEVDTARHLILAYLFSERLISPISSKDLTDAQWYGLLRFCGFYQDDDGQWHTQEYLERELVACLVAASVQWLVLHKLDQELIGVIPVLASARQLGALVRETDEEEQP